MLVPFGSKVVSFFSTYRHESVCNPVLVALPGEMGRGFGGEQRLVGPPSPSAGGEEQWEDGSGRRVGLAGSRKRSWFPGLGNWPMGAQALNPLEESTK